MYDRTFWQDHVVDEQGQVIVQGTNLCEDNFNNIEKGVFENRVIELLNTKMNNLNAQDEVENALNRVEGRTVTSSNKTINVAFDKSKNNTNYEIIPIISNPVGLDKYYVTISAKQANGFIATVYGDYTSLKVDFLVKGGIL